MEVKENFNLKAYNTFAVDVKCKYFVESDKGEDFAEFAKAYDLSRENVLVLGGGSNLLFTEDFDGVVLYPSMRGFRVEEEDDESVRVSVGSGEVWDDFVAWAVEHGYGGVENLSLVPGHVGATPVQNIGAYGVEAGETIKRVEAVDLISGEKVEIGAEDCRFGYRDSIFKHEWRNRFVVTQVTYCLTKRPEFRLDYGNVREEVLKMGEVSLRHVREAITRIREAKLPDVNVLPNAGSFFKNPVVGEREAEALRAKYPELPVYAAKEGGVKLAAGWLIEQAGWKGRAHGHAAVHDKQALVLVNRGGATGIEIARLANEVKKAVFMRFGVVLEPEVNII